MPKLIALSLFVSLLAGCGAAPEMGERVQSTALAPIEARATRIGRATAPLVERQAGEKSGIQLLPNALDAFAARTLLAQAAERTLDIQYYIWRADLTGTLLFQSLLAAADRGVRVRLLLDDHGTKDLDAEIADLDSHSNIEVRLFNPFEIRSAKWLGYLLDFNRVNRRMHNKSFIADNSVSIVGGRNVGDEYFGAADGVLFSDLDVLTIGPIVAKTSADFDRYWSSASSYPVKHLLAAVEAPIPQLLKRRIVLNEKNSKASAYLDAVGQLPIIEQLISGELPLVWAPVQIVSDDPAKAQSNENEAGLLTEQLARILGTPDHEVFLVSPYFVPTAAGAQAFIELVRQGVKVSVLTNSFEATDVAIVHAGYVKYRKVLLEGGVELFEMRSSGPQTNRSDNGGQLGSSGASLHAKTFAIDEESLFVGSFNFDPRSINLNTELGFVIESPELASMITATLKQVVPANAYEVRLNSDDDLVWIEQTTDKAVQHDSEPGASWWQRYGIRLLSWLPIDWML